MSHQRAFDLIMTSPPYAEKRISSYGGTPPSKYVEWFLPISKQLLRLLKPQGSFVLNIKEHPIGGERQTYVLELILEMRKQGWRWIEEYCWYKKNSFPGKWNNRFRDSWERCLHFSKQKEISMYQDSVTVPIGAWANVVSGQCQRTTLWCTLRRTTGISTEGLPIGLERRTCIRITSLCLKANTS